MKGRGRRVVLVVAGIAALSIIGLAWQPIPSGSISDNEAPGGVGAETSVSSMTDEASVPDSRNTAELALDREPVAGEVLLEAKWGSGEDEVGHRVAGPVWGPHDFAVSPDCSEIAVLDSANARIQIYDREGLVKHSISLAGDIGIYLEYLENGQLAVFHPGEEYEVIIATDSGVANSTVVADLNIVCGEPAMPSGIAAVHNDVWVQGTNEYWWPVVLAGEPQPPDAQASLSVAGAGRPTEAGFAKVTWESENLCSVSVTDESTSLSARMALKASDAPINVVRVLGTDEHGNLYVQLEVGTYDKPARSPYRVVRIGPTGEKTGELQLSDRPDDAWFSTGIKVGRDGDVYQMLRDLEGIQIIVYSFVYSF